MRYTSGVVAILIVILATSVCRAQYQDDQRYLDRRERPATLPDVTLGGVTLKQAMENIRQAQPDFDYVIVPENGVDSDGPTLPAMQASNVTIAQFMDFLGAAFPNAQIRSIAGNDAPPLYVIRLMGDQRPMQQSQVRVFRLDEIVKSMAADDSDKAKSDAMGKVMSLVQEALDATQESTPAVLKLDEPTQTLIFRGSPMQGMAVDSALAALGRGPDGAGNMPRYQEMMAARQAEAMSEQMVTLQEQNNNLRAQIAALKVQSSASTRP